jgi:F-type H+-transporting ATPase subunit gamma
VPSLLDIRRRIRAVKSTQQITKAMKMIAASKLRRAQDRVIGARPFARQMLRVLNSLASRVDPVDPSLHPLLAAREVRPDAHTLLIVITADKGLCGGFNTNTIKAAGQFITSAASAGRGVGAPVTDRAEASGEIGAPRSEGTYRGVGAPGSKKVALGLVGRKGRDFFRRRGFDVRFEEIGIFQKVRYTDAQRIARAAIDEFTTGAADSVHVVYNEFKSVMQQRVVAEQLLPIPRLEGEKGSDPRAHLGGLTPAVADIDYLYEPEPRQIFSALLPRHVEIQVYRALLESAAAEHAARMTAMDAATKNSTELIDSLTLYMNKVRQAAITREIIEVVSGAQGQ